MSFRGIFALFLEAALLIMVMGTEIREFLIAAVCLGGLLVLSLFSVLWAIFCLRFSAFCENTSCDRGKSIKFTLRIKGLLILPAICRVRVLTPFRERRKAKAPIYSNLVLNVLRLNRSYDFSVNCPHSGHWLIGVKRLTITDLFGFFKVSLLATPKKRCTTEISVTPKFHIQPDSAEIIGGIDNYSGLAFGNSELGEVFEDNRAYRYGDPLRRINWKQSVKIGKPITRLYEKPKKSRVIIAIDTYTLEKRGSCDDAYRETALFIAEYFVGYKNDVTVCLLRPETLGAELNCNDTTELSALALDLADLSFKYDTSPLTDAPLKDFDFDDRDRLFIITSNPAQAILTSADIMNSQGLYVSVITPKTASLNKELNSRHLTIFEGCEEISEKVGAVL